MLNGDEIPLVVAEWRKNSTETVKVIIDKFQARLTIDVRSWVCNPHTHEEKATAKGLTLRIEQLPDLARGVNAALAKAIELGLVGASDDQD